MKKYLVALLAGLTALTLLTGCLDLSRGGTTEVHNPTLGQQLIDLQKARDAGIITDAEFQCQKARLLGVK